jgi:iron(III) transport system ATP-binding protein
VTGNTVSSARDQCKATVTKAVPVPAPSEPAGTKPSRTSSQWGRRGSTGATFAARLTFEDVRRWYGDVQALCGVTLDVAAGETVCLLGASGCGKTTLLRIATGIEKPSAGRVLLDNVELAGPNRFVAPERRNIGLMFQEFALFPHLTNRQNVAFGLWSLPKHQALAIAGTVLERVGLSRYADNYPHVLSGGEQQRVALARAMAPRPAVLLMDEPFSGLDQHLRQSMQDETLTLLKETRATSIIVTHDPEEAMRMADRIGVMRAGRLLQIGTAETLYRDPATIDVARLFSHINEFDGIVRQGVVDTSFGKVPAPGLSDGQHVTVGLRQRSIELLPSGQGRAARVRDIKFLGDVGVVELIVDGLEDRIRARVPSSVRYNRGDDLSLGVDATSMLVFAARDDG